MNAKFLLPLIAAAFFSVSSHAHDCSGGANGGMDATGNQCNESVAAAEVSSVDASTSSADSPKGDTGKPNVQRKSTARKITAASHQAAHTYKARG